MAFVVSGATGIAALLAILPLPNNAPTHHVRQSPRQILRGLGQGLRQIVGDRAIRMASLMETTLCAGVGTLQAYLPLYALSVYISVAQIGLLFGNQNIASIVLRPLILSAADRYGRKPFIATGSLSARSCWRRFPTSEASGRCCGSASRSDWERAWSRLRSRQ